MNIPLTQTLAGLRAGYIDHTNNANRTQTNDQALPSPEATLATTIAQDEAYADALAHLADEGWEYEAIAVDKPARKPRARKPALTAEQKALAKATAPKAPRKSRKATCY